MDYVSVAEARTMPGLRLALSAGTCGPWGEAAKAIFKLRNVPFVPVRQHIMQANEELVEWTGFRNAPVAVYNDEPGVAGWIEILNLAERLGSGPSLLPEDEVERMKALGKDPTDKQQMIDYVAGLKFNSGVTRYVQQAMLQYQELNNEVANAAHARGTVKDAEGAAVRSSISATVPETTGAAMDVPLSV